MCRAVPLRDSPSSALLLHDRYSKQQITLLKVHRTLQRYSHRMNAAKLNRLYQSVLKSRPVSFSSLRARCRNQREHLTTRRVWCKGGGEGQKGLLQRPHWHPEVNARPVKNILIYLFPSSPFLINLFLFSSFFWVVEIFFPTRYGFVQITCRDDLKMQVHLEKQN